MAWLSYICYKSGLEELFQMKCQENATSYFLIDGQAKQGNTAANV
jgi:hypothetical protein